jgi:hypothetical protein
VCNDGSGSRLGSYDTSTYPGSGTSTPKVKPLLPALLFILSTRWLTRLLELYCVEVVEEVFDLPTLRVQAPLYRQGPGYRLVSGCPAAGSSMAAFLTWAPPSSGPLSGRRPLYKAPFPLDQHIRSICFLSAPDPFMEEGLAHCSWWRLSVAGSRRSPASVDLVRAMLLLIKRMLEGFRRLRRLGPLAMKMSAGYWRSQPFG